MSRQLQDLLAFGSSARPAPLERSPEQEERIREANREYASRVYRDAVRVREEHPDYDRDAYTRGWKASARTQGFALEQADGRGEPNEWYDGYMDNACGRDKWHRPLCPAHHNEEGGCGQA